MIEITTSLGLQVVFYAGWARLYVCRAREWPAMRTTSYISNLPGKTKWNSIGFFYFQGIFLISF